MKMVIVALVAAMVCVGCGKKDEAAPAPPSQPEKAAAAKAATTPGSLPTAAPAVAVPDADDDIPTPADFEGEAAKDITKDNLDSEVDKLAKEIGE